MKASNSLSAIIVLVTLLTASCTKDQNYPTDSVRGPWFCVEEGAGTSYRQYNVNISYESFDETQIILYNFHNLGIASETYATIQDTVITIFFNSSFQDISGTGHIKRDYTAIYWEYNYNGNYFNALFRRP